jgi:hypothetical protein
VAIVAQTLFGKIVRTAIIGMFVMTVIKHRGNPVYRGHRGSDLALPGKTVRTGIAGMFVMAGIKHRGNPVYRGYRGSDLVWQNCPNRDNRDVCDDRDKASR